MYLMNRRNRLRSPTTPTHVSMAREVRRFRMRPTTHFNRCARTRSRSSSPFKTTTKLLHAFQPLCSLSDVHRDTIRIIMTRCWTRSSTNDNHWRTTFAFPRCIMDLANARRRLRVDNMSYHESNARHSKRRWMRLTTDLILWSSVLRTVSAMRLSFVHSFQVNKPALSIELDQRATNASTKERCLRLSRTKPLHPSIAMHACLFFMRLTSLRSPFRDCTNALHPRQADESASRCMRSKIPRFRCATISWSCR